MRQNREGGFTIAELLVALTVSSIVIIAVLSVLGSVRGLFVRQNVTAGSQQALRAGATLLSTELEGIQPAEGDIVGWDDGLPSGAYLMIRGLRAVGVICDSPPVAAAELMTVSGSFVPGYQASIFSEGDPADSDDDVWVSNAVTATSAGSGSCAGIPRSTQNVLFSAAPPASVSLGALVRGYEVVAYAPLDVYGDGVLYLAQCVVDAAAGIDCAEPDDGGGDWSQVGWLPVVGPIIRDDDPSTGNPVPVFRYLDAGQSDLVPGTDPFSALRLVEIHIAAPASEEGEAVQTITTRIEVGGG